MTGVVRRTVLEKEILIGYQEASGLFWEEKVDEALEVCLSLLKRFPSNAPLLNLAGSSLYKKNMLPEAESVLSAAHKLAPETEEITLNLVRVLRKMDQTTRALIILKKTLVHRPNSPRLLSALGEIHYFSKNFELSAELFEKTLLIEPGNTETLFRLACAYQEIDRTEDAFIAYKRILELSPSHPEACVNLGQIYKSLGDHEASMALFRKSAALKPDDPAYSSRALFCRNYSFAAGEQLLREAVQWADKFAAPFEPETVDRPPKTPTSPFKLGFISADFSMHPVGKLLLPVIQLIDKNLFDVHCFANVQIEDEMTRKFKKTVPNYYDIKDMNDHAVQNMIKGIGIDILIDLSGHTNFNRLGVLAGKPAPTQIMWLGYFNTTGMKSMDYVLADWVNIPPGNDKFYQEAVLRLPDSFFPYVTDESLPIPDRDPSAPMSFGCFNDSGKINDKVLEAWSAILKEVPDSRLILKSKTFSDHWVRDIFIERAMKQDITPHRLIFLGPSSYHDYLQAYSMVDIALDPFPYSGGATTADALSTGTPVLTCPFDSFASRLSASILKACDMNHLVCNDLEEYVSKAIALATDNVLLNEVREKLRSSFKTSRFCDVKRFTRDFEQTLLGVLHKQSH